MVEEVNGGYNSIDSENIDLNRRAIHIHGGWNTTWLNMPKIALAEAHKSQEVNSKEILITIQENF
jgi:hypothetical protein